MTVPKLTLPIPYFIQKLGVPDLTVYLYRFEFDYCKEVSHFCFNFFFFLSALGLRCCARAFSSCGEQGLLFIAVRKLLIVVASPVVEHGLQACGLQQLKHAGSVVVAHGLQGAGSVVVACRLQGMQASVVVVHGLSSCGTRAQLLRSTWNLPGPGIEPVSAALAGRFLTTAPRGKSLTFVSIFIFVVTIEVYNLFLWSMCIWF